jgi:hypothetical protein
MFHRSDISLAEYKTGQYTYQTTHTHTEATDTTYRHTSIDVIVALPTEFTHRTMA